MQIQAVRCDVFFKNVHSVNVIVENLVENQI